jgi:2-dehydropantoate 2-reductase
MPVCDVVLVCLKATDNAVLERILPRVLAPGGTVVLLQNGLGVEPWLQSIVPGATVIGGLCFIASSKVGVGHIRHQDYGRVTLGQFAADYAPCGITPCLAQLADAFTAAGIETVTSTDLRDARWRKLVWNIPFNGLSAILRLTTAELLGRAPARGLVCELMAEVLAGAAACGAPIEAAFIDRMIEMTERIAPYKPSMLLDAEAGRPMEVEAIYGAPVRYAQRAGVEMRLTHCLALQLAALASAS